MTTSGRSDRTMFSVISVIAIVLVLMVGVAVVTVPRSAGGHPLHDHLIEHVDDPLRGWPVRHARSESDPASPLRVVTSVGIFADLARNVGGDAVTVTALIPAEADPHAWDPSIVHMKAVASADVFIYNGLGMEPWVDRLVSGSAGRDLIVLRLADGAVGTGPAKTGMIRDEASASGAAKGAEHVDPHLWLDVGNTINYVRLIEETFRQRRADRADVFAARANAYVGELRALDEWFQRQVDAIPKDKRLLVTDHDAYTHMAERYGLTRIGALVSNPDREPSAREMARLVESVRNLNVPAVFAEPHIGTSFIDELARETGVTVGILYTDALTNDVTTYVEMMRANGAALRKFLGGGES